MSCCISIQQCCNASSIYITPSPSQLWYHTTPILVSRRGYATDMCMQMVTIFHLLVGLCILLHLIPKLAMILQGTAATAVAGVYGALAVQGKPVQAITEQKFVVVGAGSAGMGVVSMLTLGMIKHVSPFLPLSPFHTSLHSVSRSCCHISLAPGFTLHALASFCLMMKA